MKRRKPKIEDIERYMILCAELVDEEGEVMRPWLDRMEEEYRLLRKPKEVDRIKAMIVRAREEDGRTAET